MLTDIWSSGNVPQTYCSLPILFSWWVSGLSTVTYGYFYRCHRPWIQDKKIEELEKSSAQDPDSSGHGSADDQNTLHLTSSQRLLKAAEIYRDTYGRSVPMPAHVQRLFGLVDERDLLDKADAKQIRVNNERDQL
ncbi:MAG: hypothetical protein HETSPECPRED_006170 [Heterodermia speciosa]|uniref:Uncharacterized protein n=1 Tax=Heterodermia speciosa TaxID=116794 RepID=A0A8H3EKY7_9LECA|nr:MAG: hypothetical protein HETSPECPRED_006170 [Heterodermia speciosa]